MRLSDDNPRRRLGRQLYTQLFDGHAYGRQVIGTPELVRGLTRETLTSFYRRHYVPEAFVVVVVGAVDPRQVLATAATTFGRLPRSGETRLPVPPPPAFRPQRQQLTHPGAHAHLGMAWPATRLDHADTPALEILNIILGQGESSRLNVSVVRHDKAAFGTGTILNPFGSRNGPGVFAVYGIINQGVSADRLDSLLGRQLDTIRANGITAAELEKAKNALRAGFIGNRETTLGKAEELHHYSTFHSSIDEINTDLDRLLAVTGDDVKRVARTYLAPGNLTLLIVRAGPGGAP